MLELQFQKFLEHFPPRDEPQKADPELLERYRDLVPPGLLELWQHAGFGFYSDGFLQLIQPDEYHEVLCGWLLRDPDPERVPFMMTAFGTLIYYRMLARDPEGKIVAEDVAYLEPHHRDSSVLSWSLEGVFNDALGEDDALSDFYRRDGFGDARALYGPLNPDEIYFYRLPLALGGAENLENLTKGDARVQLEILLQLALG